MGPSRGNLAALGAATLVVMGLAGCSSGNPGANSSPAAAVTPRLVTPTPIGGSPGRGPTVISSPAPLPGGRISSQKVVLGDRTLIINSVTSQRGAIKNSILIDLDIVVLNTSGKAIKNQAAFFQLVGPGGDTFGYQDNSSDTFYGTIGAHASRSSTIEFQIPAAAGSDLYLLYRPEIATETVLTRLTIGVKREGSPRSALALAPAYFTWGNNLAIAATGPARCCLGRVRPVILNEASRQSGRYR